MTDTSPQAAPAAVAAADGPPPKPKANTKTPPPQLLLCLMQEVSRECREAAAAGSAAFHPLLGPSDLASWIIVMIMMHHTYDAHHAYDEASS